MRQKFISSDKITITNYDISTEHDKPLQRYARDIKTEDKPNERKAKKDETIKKQTTEDKIMIKDYDLHKEEKTKKQESLKDINVGRLVIKEMPPEKETKPTKEKKKDNVDRQFKPRDELTNFIEHHSRDRKKEMVKDDSSYRGPYVIDHPADTETKINVIDERAGTDTSIKDRRFMDVQKQSEPRFTADRVDGVYRIDDKTTTKKKDKITSGKTDFTYLRMIDIQMG